MTSEMDSCAASISATRDGSIQEECLSKMIFVGEGMLHRALREFVTHYHEERNHQGVGNRLLRPHAEDLGGTTASRSLPWNSCRALRIAQHGLDSGLVEIHNHIVIRSDTRVDHAPGLHSPNNLFHSHSPPD